MNYFNGLIKRIFDITFSLFAITITFPIMLIIALIIKITDKGKVFFAHQRVGQNGKKIRVLKFRTMFKDADKRLDEILRNNPKAKKEWNETHKLKDDPRVTPIGRFLRKTSLDELPQFFNVIKGDMSIVGPRPVTEEELQKFYKEKSKLYKKIKPGITGFWQISGRNDTSYQERVEMDIWYINNKNFLLDLKIILKTIRIIFSKKGAY